MFRRGQQQYSHLAGSGTADDGLPPDGLPDRPQPFRNASDGGGGKGYLYDAGAYARLDGQDNPFLDPSQRPPKVQFDADESKYIRPFRADLQLRRILFESLVKWALGAIIIGLFLLTIFIYKANPNISRSSLHWYNSISLGLQLCLSLNLSSALKTIARILRWRILAQKPHTISEVDMILSAESLSTLASLALSYLRSAYEEMFGPLLVHHKILQSPAMRRVSSSLGYSDVASLKSRQSFTAPRKRDLGNAVSKTFASFKVMLWLALNIAAQVGIALIGITVSTEPSGNVILPPPIGPTWVSDVSVLTPPAHADRTPSTSDQQFAANSLGITANSFLIGTVDGTNDPNSYGAGEDAFFDVFEPNQDDRWFFYRYYNFDNSSYYQYRFAVPTNRTVKVTYDNCWAVVADKVEHEEFANNLEDRNGSATVTFSGNRTIRVDLTGVEATTFFYTGPLSFCENNNPRCAPVMAYQDAVNNSDVPSNGIVYSCEITVGNVQGVDPRYAKAQEIGDETALFLGAAIGMSGFGSTQDVYVDTQKPTGAQFQRYTIDSIYSLSECGSDSAAGNCAGQVMAQFSVAAIAAQNVFSSKVQQIGPSASQGNSLSIEWQYLILILSIIGGMHLILAVAACLYTYRYVQPDGSNLAIARVLRYVLGEGSVAIGKDGRGAVLTGEEIAAVVEEDVLRGQKVLYGTKSRGLGAAGTTRWELRLFPEDEIAAGRSGGARHVDGDYL